MSAPPLPPTSGPSSIARPRPTPPGGNKPSDLTTTVLSNLQNLLQMDQVGKLSTLQQNQLRQLIITQTKPIVLHAMLQNRPNPLLSLPSHLDPTRAWEHGPAVIVKEKFEAEIASAVAAAHAHIQRNGVPAGGGAGAGAGVNRVLPAGLLTLPELRDYLKIEPAERAIMLEANQLLKARFNASVNYWTKMSQQQNASRTPTAGAQGRPPTAAFLGAATASSVIPVLVDGAKPEPGRPMMSRPPPQPVEDEPARKRRKFREYMGELAPGLDLEYGIAEVLSEVLESFVDEAARGSIRVAKHRRSDKVELKDAAFFLDQTYGITVPGYNVQPTRRIHLAPEGERKRGRVVAPKAARMARGNAAKEEE